MAGYDPEGFDPVRLGGLRQEKWLQDGRRVWPRPDTITQLGVEWRI